MYSSDYLISVAHPETGEDVEASVYFWYYEGYPGSTMIPAEIPEVEITHIYVDGKNILNKMSLAAYRHLCSSLLEEMLQNGCARTF